MSNRTAAHGPRRASGALTCMLLLSACVTINVYFPAAAAEKAADKIIEEVWGGDAQRPEGAPAAPAGRPTSQLAPPPGQPRDWWLAWFELIIPAAQAQANIDASSPAIEKLKQSMHGRHGELSTLYASGAVGLTEDGLVAARDLNAVDIKARQSVARLVAAENSDRSALYREIARANGHPEWEAQVRSTFARRWIELARGGWWYQSGGAWKQK